MHLLLEYLSYLPVWAACRAIWKLPDFGCRVLAFLRDFHAYRDEREAARRERDSTAAKSLRPCADCRCHREAEDS